VTQYRLTPRARCGVGEILGYVEREFGAGVAADTLERIVAAFDLIAACPAIGHLREDITRDRSIRFSPVGPSLIAYRSGGPGQVEVLFVERGERDWERMLDEEP